VFRDVAIPAGSVITKASIFFKSHDTLAGVDVDADIHFVDEDDPNPPTDKSDLEGRLLTDYVEWKTIQDWYDNVTYRTPNLKDILQPIIDRSGWVSGNKVMAVLKSWNPTLGVHRLWSAEEFLGGTEKACLRASWRPPTQLQEPRFDPTEGFQLESFDCTLRTYPTDASIYYTTDGSTPDENDTLYTGPFEIAENTTVKAKAYKEYWSPSEVASKYYELLSLLDYEIIYSAEVVNPGLSSALDASGYMHVIIGNYPSNQILHLYNIGGGWESEVVYTAPTSAAYDIAGMVFDDSGYLHVLFVSKDSFDEVRYATNTLGYWTTIVITGGIAQFDTVACGGSILIDASGYIHLFYAYVYSPDSPAYHLTHSTNASGSWQTEFIQSQANLYNAVRAKLKSNGDFVVAFDGIVTSTMYVATGTWGSWSIENCGATDSSDNLIGFDLDSSEKMHIVYGENVGSNGRLFYLTDKTGSWAETDITPDVGYKYFFLVDLLETGGVLHAMCTAAKSGAYDLFYMNNSGGSWSSEHIREGELVVGFNSILLRGSAIELFYRVQYLATVKNLERTTR